MANRFRGEIPIQLDKERKLRFTANAMVELEDSLGYNPKKILLRFQKQAELAKKLEGTDDTDSKVELAGQIIERDLELSNREIRSMLWAGLLDNEPNLSIRKAGELIDMAPGDTEVEKESYVAARVVTAFLSRFVSRSATEAMAKNLGIQELEASQT